VTGPSPVPDTHSSGVSNASYLTTHTHTHTP